MKKSYKKIIDVFSFLNDVDRVTILKIFAIDWIFLSDVFGTWFFFFHQTKFEMAPHFFRGKTFWYWLIWEILQLQRPFLDCLLTGIRTWHGGNWQPSESNKPRPRPSIPSFVAMYWKRSIEGLENWFEVDSILPFRIFRRLGQIPTDTSRSWRDRSWRGVTSARVFYGKNTNWIFGEDNDNSRSF